MQSRTLAVRPEHGDFFHGKTHTPRQKEDFGIESPALDLLQWENALRGLAAKGLESALGVGIIQAQKQAQDQVEDSSEGLAVERLPLGLKIGAEPARSDRDVGSGGDRVEQFGRLTDWRGEIGIGEQADIATRMQHTVANAETLTAIAGILHEQDLGMHLAVLADDLCGVVARSVIDDQNFDVPTAFL